MRHFGRCPRRAHSIVGLGLGRQGLAPFSNDWQRVQGVTGPREPGLKFNRLGLLKSMITNPLPQGIVLLRTHPSVLHPLSLKPPSLDWCSQLGGWTGSHCRREGWASSPLFGGGARGERRRGQLSFKSPHHSRGPVPGPHKGMHTCTLSLHTPSSERQEPFISVAPWVCRLGGSLEPWPGGQ